MRPCKHASSGCTCLEMIICTAAIVGEPIDEMDCYEPVCLWEAYQADQSYRNCCAWLKHRAYCGLTCQHCPHLGIEHSLNLIYYCKKDTRYASCNTILMKNAEGCR